MRFFITIRMDSVLINNMGQYIELLIRMRLAFFLKNAILIAERTYPENAID